MATQFEAMDEHGNKVVILHDLSEDLADGSGRTIHWGLTTLSGKDVVRDEKGVYRIKGSSTRLTSADPTAP